jgi:hypothetical protein
LITKVLASPGSTFKPIWKANAGLKLRKSRDSMVADDRPYVVESPTRIRLGPDAKHWAHEYGMTLEEFARYLLHRHHHGEDVLSIQTPEISVQNVNLPDGEQHVKHPSWSIGHPNLHPSEDVIIPNLRAEGR